MNFWKNGLESNLIFFWENCKQEHIDINMLDMMCEKQKVTCLNTFGTGDKNMMGVE